MEIAPLSSTRQPPKLPIEVWESVIDQLTFPNSTLWNVRMDLAACSLVCRAWVPRCLFYLFTALTLRTDEQLLELEYAVLRMANIPGLSKRVTVLIIHCLPETDQSWVSLIPLHLPRLDSLTALSIIRFDFTKRHPNFSAVYRAFKVDALEIAYCVYSRYSQITQLACAVHAKKLTVAGQARPYLAPTKRPGHLPLVAVFTLELFVLKTTWRGLQDVSNVWRVRSSVQEVQLIIVSHDSEEINEYWDPPGLLHGDAPAMWQRISALHHDMSLFYQRGTRGFGHKLGPSVSVLRGTDVLCSMRLYHAGGFHPDSPGTFLHLLELAFCGEYPRIIIDVLRGVISSDWFVHSVVLPHVHDGIASQAAWEAIDDCLTHARFAGLLHCDIVAHNEHRVHVEKHPVIDMPYRCLHEEYRARMPRTAARGFFRCAPDVCALRRVPG
ncbi:hypothetical protein BXZ70DRAFT_495341 [Cristinia sonorae]|uniref:F-box domain-containing protein n=1 Tax=Cristinia sonorae TaxID=1940300 RepID=A0A8K0UHQ1_9AGAR|nr:hypothetical protein BXZ70DRAFT_495341 [Cristinia sonorae]